MKYPQLGVRVRDSILSRGKSILSSRTASTKAEVQKVWSFPVEVLRGQEGRVVQAEIEKLSVILSAVKVDKGFAQADAIFCLTGKKNGLWN